MKFATLKNSKWVRSTWMVASLLLVTLSMTGCPSKKDSSNNNIAVTPYQGYQYGPYCGNAAGCIGQPGYGNMFASGLGRIDYPSSLVAEVALNFVATGGGYSNIQAYGSAVQISGTMNVYSSSQLCPIPPGQYQLYGTGNWGGGFGQKLSFTAQMQGVGATQLNIVMPNTFVIPGPVSSIVGPSFPYTINNIVEIYVPAQWGMSNCGGSFTMY